MPEANQNQNRCEGCGRFGGACGALIPWGPMDRVCKDCIDGYENDIALEKPGEKP